MGYVCSSAEFSEMMVSFLGIDSPAASTPGILGAEFSAYSGGRRRFVVDAGGWEVERVQMTGDGWRDAHDHVSDVLFDIAFHSGIRGSVEPRGIFSQAVPAEVLARAIDDEAEASAGRRSKPGAIPDAQLTIGGRRLLYDVKLIRLCPSRYWPTHAVADARGGPLEFRATKVASEYLEGARSLDIKTANHYRAIGQEPPAGRPSAVDILGSFPTVQGLVFGSTACGGSRDVGTLIDQAATSAAQREWRRLGSRTVTDARAFIISVMRRQISFAAAVAHARLRLSRLELIGHSGRAAGRYASAAGAFVSPSLWEQRAGSGRDRIGGY